MRNLIVWAIAISLGAVPSERGPTMASGQQPSTVLIRVVDTTSRTPLVNAEVTDLNANVPRFTNEQGEVRLAWPGGGPLRLRVRQLGFQYVERVLTRGTGSDTVTFALTRVVYTLPTVATRVSNSCGVGADSVSRRLSVMVLEQLRAGAERYESFRRAYPFRVRQERRTMVFGRDGKPEQVHSGYEEVESNKWGDRYDPKTIVIRSGVAFSVAILFVANLGDDAFWRNHCFEVLGVESLHGRRVLRLEFTPSPSARGTEWSGHAFVDSATSILRRVEFSLTGLPRTERPTRYEGYTTFRSPSPLIAVPDSTAAMWWRREVPADSAWGSPDVVQLIRVTSMTYRKGAPPADSSAPPGSPRRRGG